MIDAPFWLRQYLEFSVLTWMLIKWTAILAAAWGWHFVLYRSNPRWRVLVWRAAALLLIVLPVLHFALPSAFRSTVLTSPALANKGVAIPSQRVDDLNAIVVENVANSAASSTVEIESALESESHRAVSLGSWILLAYVAVCLFLIARIILSWRRVVGLIDCATVPTERLALLWAEACACQGVAANNIQLRVSHEMTTPSIFGGRGGTLLLPADLADPEFESELPSVFLHEIAHFRSNDLLWNHLLIALGTLLWFHPLVWLMRRVHAAACERVSDAVAAQEVGSVESYTRTLAKVALASHGAPGFGFAMARSSSISSRIRFLANCHYDSQLNTRRVVLASCLACFLVFGLGSVQLRSASAQDGPSEKVEPGKPKDPIVDLVTPKTLQQVELGLQFLASRQNADGSIGTNVPDKRIASTAIGGLAFLASGSKLSSGKYKKELRKCVNYVIGQVKVTGMVGGQMYVHAYALQFLSRVQIASPDPSIKVAITKMTTLAEKAQNELNGWRYSPVATSADVSITSCMLVGLQEAQRAGVTVNPKTIQRAISYISSCQVDGGGFCYVANTPGSALARSAAAMAALSLSKVENEELTENGFDYVIGENVDLGSKTIPFFFYTQYYASIAMRYRQPDDFTLWYKSVHKHLLKIQRADGSWTDKTGDEYATANSCVVLLSPLSGLRK